ncbi:CLUMA_CG010994, isoform A [Clunio marinus]|uniref:CLUMA_CG010994, isoform A n=1 Tax=Clunio marinus TaxID=568069 RepID=A0A1J1IBJ3_9DIPT|nr:CLUMA_CG010994, isoform A [Clunio marinus]
MLAFKNVEGSKLQISRHTNPKLNFVQGKENMPINSACLYVYLLRNCSIESFILFIEQDNTKTCQMLASQHKTSKVKLVLISKTC